MTDWNLSPHSTGIPEEYSPHEWLSCLMKWDSTRYIVVLCWCWQLHWVFSPMDKCVWQYGVPDSWRLTLIDGAFEQRCFRLCCDLTYDLWLMVPWSDWWCLWQMVPRPMMPISHGAFEQWCRWCLRAVYLRPIGFLADGATICKIVSQTNLPQAASVRLIESDW